VTLLNHSLRTHNTDVKSVESFLVDFELSLEDTLSCIDKPLLSQAREVVLCGGKRYRPTLCFLSGFPQGNYNDLINASIVVELVHVASLVHDDVLDNAQRRRGNVTIHNKIGINNAILLGDSLFSYALELSTEFQDNMVCKIVSRATRKTCSGEIAQNFSIGDFGVTLKEYEQIISDKTGYLFGASCQLGGTLSGVDSFDRANLESVGVSLGICYQIFDDIIDAFGNETNSGKSLGTDFLSFKPTLPILLLLECCSKADYLKITKLLSTSSKSNFRVQEVSSYFEQYDILNKCLTHFHNNFERTIFLINSLKSAVIKDNLIHFISSFSKKVNFLNTLKQSNFLAVHS
jgi:octaprenyl-diphosphate synthase